MLFLIFSLKHWHLCPPVTARQMHMPPSSGGGSKHLWNVCPYLQDYTWQCSRRHFEVNSLFYRLLMSLMITKARYFKLFWTRRMKRFLIVTLHMQENITQKPKIITFCRDNQPVCSAFITGLKAEDSSKKSILKAAALLLLIFHVVFLDHSKKC
jgi:hypothetical protein